MNRIEAAFQSGEPLLMPFVTLGDPSLEATVEIVVELANQGAGMLELGLPYSDPIADGPTIQASSQRSLARGTRLADAFQVIRAVRQRTQIPIVLFTYCNPIYRYGLERFLSEAAAAGADGLIMPDIPPEEAQDLRELAEGLGLAPVFLIAPTTTEARMPLVCSASRGFVYLVAATGVTGARAGLAEGLEELVKRVKAHSRLPVAVGFGVSNPDQAAAIARMGADGVIVGSALVDRIGRWATEPDLVTRVGSFVADLATALKKEARISPPGR